MTNADKGTVWGLRKGNTFLALKVLYPEYFKEKGPCFKSYCFVYISVGKCKKDLTPLLAHWSYIFIAITHRLGANRIPAYYTLFYEEANISFFASQAISHNDWGGGSNVLLKAIRGPMNWQTFKGWKHTYMGSIFYCITTLDHIN